MTTSRTISTATATEIAKADNSLGWLVEIIFESFTGRYCSYSQVTWNSLVFVAASLKAGNIDTDSKQATLTFFDPDASMRTLCLTGRGARNSAIRIWKFYVSALGASDPMMVFKGVGDQCVIQRGQIDIACARSGIGVLYSPRKRLSPSTGCNFLAAPGTLVPWGQKILELEPRRRG